MATTNRLNLKRAQWPAQLSITGVDFSLSARVLTMTFYRGGEVVSGNPEVDVWMVEDEAGTVLSSNADGADIGAVDFTSNHAFHWVVNATDRLTVKVDDNGQIKLTFPTGAVGEYLVVRTATGDEFTSDLIDLS